MKHFNQDARMTEAFAKHGAFFAFGNKQFNEKKQEGVEYISIGAGLIAPKSNADSLITALSNITKEKVKWELANNTKKEIIWYELANHECQIVGSWEEAYSAVKCHGITEDEVKAEWSAYMDHCIEHDYF